MRKKLSMRGSKKLFRAKSIPRKKNYVPVPMRGGFRI